MSFNAYPAIRGANQLTAIVGRDTSDPEFRSLRNQVSGQFWSNRGPLGEDGKRMAQGTPDRYWARTSTLMWIMLVLWLFFSFGVHFFVNTLNQFTVFGFPVGFYMASQGSLIAFVVMLFLFASRQDTIDREEGVAEDN